MRRPPRCNCRCKPPVNFRVFNSTDGTLLWERLMDSQPSIGTDGRVWEAVDTPFSHVSNYGTPNGTSSASYTLPARGAIPFGNQNVLRHYNSYNGVTGALMTTSPQSPQLPMHDGLVATRYRINASGLIMSSTNGFAGFIQLNIVDNLNSGPVEYWLSQVGNDSATITLTSNPVSSTATFNLASSAGAVRSAILSAFGALCTSVTVTAISGTNIGNGFFKIVIDWASSSSHLATFAWLGRVQTRSSFIYNLVTGTRVSVGGTSALSFSYSQPGIWLTETKLVRASAVAGSATQPIIEAWDTTTNPWTALWNDAYSTGHAVRVPGESLLPVALSAHRSRVIASFALMGATPFSTRLYSETGSVLASVDYAYMPRNAHFSDDSDEFTAYFLQRSRSSACIENGLSCSAKTYRDNIGAGFVVSNLTGSTLTYYNTGTRQGGTSPNGFNSTGILAIAAQALSQPAASFDLAQITADISTIDSWRLDSPTGLSNPLLPSTCYVSHWLLSSPDEFLVSTGQWRLNWPAVGTTNWLDEDATIADINSQLLVMFGSDVDGRPNVFAEFINTLPTWNAIPLPQVWQKNMRVTARCARNSTEAALTGMDIYLSAAVPAAIKPLQLETRRYVSARTAAIAMLDRYDGREIWSRGFSASNPDSRCSGTLHDGKVYCYSETEVIGEL